MRIKDDVSKLTHLGHMETEYPDHAAPSLLETFPNRFPGREYQITFETEEFTSLCPKTGQPDFGSITITYVPGESCIESKSLKLYLFSFRNEACFMETLTNTILDDLVAACKPRRMIVTGNFRPRGGIGIVVEASYEAGYEAE
jgi:7-cyano-7-deazaguanine reductase